MTIEPAAAPRRRVLLLRMLLIRMVLGCAVMLVGVAGLLALAGALHPGSRLLEFDAAMLASMRTNVAPAVLPVAAVLTHLADPITLTVLGFGVALVLLFQRQWPLALGWVLALGGNGLLNQTLKQVYGRARPLALDGGVLADGLSFPSGHSSGALVACGMLSYVALRLLPPRWHQPALLAAVVLTLAVGASRLLLRVHFASDVLAGFASGLAWLALCITTLECCRSWQART
jgi:undecaprenyl-diphosphatase